MRNEVVEMRNESLGSMVNKNYNLSSLIWCCKY